MSTPPQQNGQLDKINEPFYLISLNTEVTAALFPFCFPAASVQVRNKKLNLLVLFYFIYFCQNEGSSEDINFTCTTEQLQVTEQNVHLHVQQSLIITSGET